jgi:hypothetical protein
MEAPAIRRDPESVTTTADLQTLMKRGEKGHFLCQSCRCVITDLVKSLPNNGQTYVRPCPGCGFELMLNPAWLMAKMIEGEQRAAQGLQPMDEKLRSKKPLPKSAGSVREEPLPDGRKRIIVTPDCAGSLGRALIGREK